MAAAINDSTDATGVSASVNPTVVSGGAVGGGGLDSNNLLRINGTAIAGIEVQSDDAGSSLVSAINAQADITGVTAARDQNGAIALTAQDGRNIEIETTGNASVVTGLSDGVTSGSVTLTGDAQFTIAGTDPADAGLAAGPVSNTPSSALSEIDVTTQAGANQAIETVDRALEQVGRSRSRFGATQNRLESTINNLSTSSINLQEANSRIRDTDFASEASELLRGRYSSKRRSLCWAKQTTYHAQTRSNYLEVSSLTCATGA